MTNQSSPDDLSWRKSTYSAQAECVEIAKVSSTSFALRNSNAIEAGFLTFTQKEISAFVRGVKAGEFDDLI